MGNEIQILLNQVAIMESLLILSTDSDVMTNLQERIKITKLRISVLSKQ